MSQQEYESLQMDIRSILLTFQKGVTLSDFMREYKNMIGCPLPFQKFEYSSPYELLQDMPSVVSMRPCGSDHLLFGVADGSTAHIQKMVSKQKAAKNPVRSRGGPRSRKYPPPKPAFFAKSFATSKYSASTASYKTAQFSANSSSTASYRTTQSSVKSRVFSSSEAKTVGSKNFELPPRFRKTAKELPSNIKKGIITLVRKYPSGVSLSDFPTIYQNYFDVEFQFKWHGYLTLKDCLQSIPELQIVYEGNQTLVQYFEDKPRESPPLQQTSSSKAQQQSLQPTRPLKNLNELDYFGPTNSNTSSHSSATTAHSRGKENFNVKPSVENVNRTLSRNINHSPTRHYYQDEELSDEDNVNVCSPGPSIKSVFKKALPSDVAPLHTVINSIKLPPEATEQFVQINTSFITNPGNFYIQCAQYSDALVWLQKEIQKFYSGEQSYFYQMDSEHVTEGVVCIAMWSLDHDWYRAKINAILSGERVEVCFLDYGNVEIISVTSLRYIKQEYTKIPIQALKCRIACVKPLCNETDYSPRACAKMVEMCQDICLMAQLDGIDDDGTLSLVICDTNKPDDVFLNDVLIEGDFVEHESNGETIVLPNSESPPEEICQPSSSQADVKSLEKPSSPAPFSQELLHQAKYFPQAFSALSQTDPKLLSELFQSLSVDRSPTDSPPLTMIGLNAIPPPVPSQIIPPPVPNGAIPPPIPKPAMPPGLASVSPIPPPTLTYSPMHFQNSYVSPSKIPLPNSPYPGWNLSSIPLPNSPYPGGNLSSVNLPNSSYQYYNMPQYRQEYCPIASPVPPVNQTDDESNTVECEGGYEKAEMANGVASDDCDVFGEDDDATFNEFYTKTLNVSKRYVKRVETKDGYRFHILLVDSGPFVSFGDVSTLIWPEKETDFLGQMLQIRGVSLANRIVSEDKNEEMFEQFQRFHIKGIYKAGMFLYLKVIPLQRLIQVLNIFGHPSIELRQSILQESEDFDLSSPVWQEISEFEIPNEKENLKPMLTDDDKISRLILRDLQVMKDGISAKKSQLESSSNGLPSAQDLQKLEKLLQKVTGRIKEVEQICQTYSKQMRSGF